MFGGHHDRAICAYQRALELNPNDADVLNDFGQCLSFAGRATEGVEVVHKAMWLNPHYPDCWVIQLGPIYFDARRNEDAISTLEEFKGHDWCSAVPRRKSRCPGAYGPGRGNYGLRH